MKSAITAAKELGLNAETVAAAAASGAIKSAGEISTTAVEEVRKVVTGTRSVIGLEVS